MDLEKVADVLDKAADYVEAVESDAAASENQQREDLIASIGEKYAEATGDDISDEMLKKLAQTDPSLLQAIEKIAETKQEDETNLGAPSERRDRSTKPDNTKEAAQDADDAFLDWILSP